MELFVSICLGLALYLAAKAYIIANVERTISKDKELKQ